MLFMVRRRRYDMTRREQAVELTRRRAVEAAYELLKHPDSTELTMEAVAARVGVTRATLYNQFGTRAALLVELFAEVGRRAGAQRIYRAMRHDDPSVAALTMLRESTRGLAREQSVVRRLFALTVFDAELSRQVAGAERARRASLVHLADRLSGAERISVTAREASALLAALTSFHAFEAVTVDAGPKLAERRLVQMLQSSLGLLPKGNEG
jgi:AcrR family transcriptional regulator